MAPGIPQLRVSIDILDREILELVARRLELVMKVGEVKRSLGLAAHDPARERDLLDKVAAAAAPPLTAAMAQRIFQCIIEESRALEQRHMAGLPASDGAARADSAQPKLR
ncbi:MAG TPA: chorismate mutase [Polyangiaceae bacterium]|nr:chorismate mutase [Polyangiaceae bacterium]